MSIALMTAAWKSDLPSGRKMVLLALCDNANDHGECYPSIPHIAKKCSMGERTVQQHITDLEKSGMLRREFRKGRSTTYHLDPRRICTTTPAESAPREIRIPQISHPTPAESAPLPPQNLHPAPADFAPITINEPSIEPSIEPLPPRPAGGDSGHDKATKASEDHQDLFNLCLPDGQPVKKQTKPPCVSPGDARFMRFWSAYPKKVGKGAAEKAWEKIKTDDALLDQMLEAIGHAMTSPKWIKDGGQYIPNPTRWLNERRWEDEDEATTNTDEVAAWLREKYGADVTPLPDGRYRIGTRFFKRDGSMEAVF